jgi:hypothetical protein
VKCLWNESQRRDCGGGYIPIKWRDKLSFEELVAATSCQLMAFPILCFGQLLVVLCCGGTVSAPSMGNACARTKARNQSRTSTRRSVIATDETNAVKLVSGHL